MSYFQWSSKYQLGHRDIDDQHHVFFDLIARIEHELKTTDDIAYEIKLLEELYHYAQFHFHSEENIYEKMELDGLDEHRLEHKKLLSDVEQEIYNFMRTRDHKHLIDFIGHWLTNHTLTEDKMMLSKA